MTRAAKVAQAQALRAQGLKIREIAARMGCARSTVGEYLVDPDHSKARARKDSYRGICTDCGGPTDGSNGAAAAPTRCTACITWTREQVLFAFEEWADDHGGLPPRCEDTYNAGRGHLPQGATVARLFGSWNAGLLAAGFELRCDRRPETWEDILASVRAGEPITSIAARYGVTGRAIHQRFRVRGLSLADERPAGFYADMHSENGRRGAAVRWGVAA